MTIKCDGFSRLNSSVKTFENVMYSKYYPTNKVFRVTNKNNKVGEIIHGNIPYMVKRISELAKVETAKEILPALHLKLPSKKIHSLIEMRCRFNMPVVKLYISTVNAKDLLCH